MLEVTTEHATELIDITDQAAQTVPEDATGVCTVFVPHTTAGVVVNETETRLLEDIQTLLDHIVPADERFAHDTIDNNAAAHLRSIVLGEHVSVPVRDGQLALGTWQSILFVECDGPRSRRVAVTVTT